jgi:hypothetical protein
MGVILHQIYAPEKPKVIKGLILDREPWRPLKVSSAARPWLCRSGVQMALMRRLREASRS